MTPPTDNEMEDENAVRRSKKGDAGEGDSDSFGRGKAGAGAGGARLSGKKSETVKGEHRHLVGAELVERFAEFCSETFILSVNLVVDFTAKTARTVNAKSFAIMHWVVEMQKNVLRELAKSRERTAAARDQRGLQQKKPNASLGMKLGPTGPTGQ